MKVSRLYYDLNRRNALLISKLRGIYDVFGMGKKMILRYNKTNSAASAVRCGNSWMDWPQLDSE